MRALATGAPLGIRRHLRRGWGPAHAIDGFHAYRMYPFVYVDGRHVPSRAHAWENTIRSAHWTTPHNGCQVFVHHLTGPYLIRFEARRRSQRRCRTAPFVLPSNTHSHTHARTLCHTDARTYAPSLTAHTVHSPGTSSRTAFTRAPPQCVHAALSILPHHSCTRLNFNGAHSGRALR